VRKNYQNQEIDTSQPAVPEQVSVALGELAGEMREGLLALAVGTGLQVMAAIMEADVTAACGPKGRHDPQRTATRHGHGAGSVTLGGRRVPVQRPRIRAVDGSGELPVPAYELFSDAEILGRMALERMLAGISTRRYPIALEPVGQRSETAATATSRSAVSRRFVAQTETALEQLLAADLSGLDLVAFMVDGVHFAEHTCVVALGIAIDGTKHPLSLVEGSTENATLVTELIVGLRERGLDVTKPVLAVLDGSKALRRAVLDVFDRPVIGRCQLHKICGGDEPVGLAFQWLITSARGGTPRRWSDVVAIQHSEDVRASVGLEEVAQAMVASRPTSCGARTAMRRCSLPDPRSSEPS